MPKVHITLQGKGGVGKSFVAAIVAQHLSETAPPVACLDTDPVNATLAGYGPLQARKIPLMQGSRLVERNFDAMMDAVLADSDSHFVIDSGASAFIPLSNYLIENNVPGVFASAGRQLVVHSVVTGGQALIDTVTGFTQLASQLPASAQLVVWLNEFFGPVSLDGIPFLDMKAYRDHKARVAGVVRIPQRNPDTFGLDVQLMLGRKLTFAEAETDSEFSFMARQRLAIIKRSIFDQLGALQ